MLDLVTSHIDVFVLSKTSVACGKELINPDTNINCVHTYAKNMLLQIKYIGRLSHTLSDAGIR